MTILMVFDDTKPHDHIVLDIIYAFIYIFIVL